MHKVIIEQLFGISRSSKWPEWKSNKDIVSKIHVPDPNKSVSPGPKGTLTLYNAAEIIKIAVIT